MRFVTFVTFCNLNVTSKKLQRNLYSIWLSCPFFFCNLLSLLYLKNKEKKKGNKESRNSQVGFKPKIRLQPKNRQQTPVVIRFLCNFWPRLQKVTKVTNHLSLIAMEGK